MKRILTIIALIAAGFTYAQPDDGGDGSNKSKKEQRKERIKAAKIGFISTELELTSEEAEKFWPIYNDMEDKMEALHKEKKSSLKKLKNFDELNEDEAYELVESIFEIEEKENKLKREYLGKFASAVGKKKAAKLYLAEEKFKRELLKKLKDRPQGGGPGGRGGGGPGGPGGRGGGNGRPF